MKKLNLTYNCLFFLLLVLISTSGYSANRYWIGGNGLQKTWNSTANWSTTSGGTGGASVPVSTDIAVFDGNSGECLLNTNINVKGITMTATFTDTLYQNSYTITSGISSIYASGGYFIGSSSAITSNGSLIVDGGNFKSTSGTCNIRYDFTYSSGVFSHNNGLIKISTSSTTFPTSSITGNATFYNLEFSANSSNKTITVTSGTVLTVNNNFNLTGSSAYNLTINAGKIHVKKDLTSSFLSSNVATGTAEIILNGSGNQTITGSSTTLGPFPKVTISKNPNDTVFFSGKLCFDNDLKIDSGFVSAGTSTVAFSRGIDITGSMTLNKVIFQNKNSGSATFNLATGTELTILDTMQCLGNYQVIINTGKINAKGNIIIKSVTSTSTYQGTADININGTGPQIIYGDSYLNCWFPGSLIINKASDTLHYYGGFGVGRTYKLLNGIVAPHDSHLGFFRTITITGNSHELNKATFYSNNGVAGSLTMADSTEITVNSDIKVTYRLSSSYSYNFTGGRIKSKGNIYMENIIPVANGTTVFEICGTGPQHIYGAGALKGNIPKIEINKSSDTLFLHDTITVNGGWQHINGNVDATTYNSALYLNLGSQNKVFTGTHTLNNVIFYRTGTGTYTLTTSSGKVITIKGNLTTLGSGLTTLIGGGTIKVEGNLTTSSMLYGGTSTVVALTGSSNQVVTGISATTNGRILNLSINKPSGFVTVNKLITVTGTLTLTKGVVYTKNADSLIVLLDNATTAGGNSYSFVSGPLRKLGNDALTFPIGKVDQYAPLTITAPSATTDDFVAEFFDVEQSLGSTIDDSLAVISNCGYWKLDRNVGSSSVKVKVGWDSSSCYKPNPYYNVGLGRWNSTTSKWDAFSSINVTGNQISGTVETGSTQSTLGYFVLGLKDRPVTYASTSRKLDGGYHLVTNNKLNFQHIEEYQNSSGELNYTIYEYPSHSAVSGLGSQDVVHGFNYYTIDISSLTSGDFYILEIINEKGEKFYMRFKKA